MSLDIFFYLFAALALGGAILTVTLRSAIHCAISLIASLAGVAGLYLLLRAEFLFAVQIVLYIGGIMVLFLFVIMLVNLDAASKQRQFHRRWWAPLGIAFLAGGGLVYLLAKNAPQLPAAGAAQSGGNVEQIADILFSEYLLPFELVSLLLLVAIIGSVLMAKKRVAE